jgi:hypothetical protein
MSAPVRTLSLMAPVRKDDEPLPSEGVRTAAIFEFLHCNEQTQTDIFDISTLGSY